MDTIPLRILLTLAEGELPPAPVGLNLHETDKIIDDLVTEGFVTYEPYEGACRPKIAAKTADDKERKRVFFLTDKGKVFVEAMVDIPFPVQTWTMP